MSDLMTQDVKAGRTLTKQERDHWLTTAHVVEETPKYGRPVERAFVEAVRDFEATVVALESQLQGLRAALKRIGRPNEMHTCSGGSCAKCIAIAALLAVVPSSQAGEPADG